MRIGVLHVLEGDSDGGEQNSVEGSEWRLFEMKDERSWRCGGEVVIESAAGGKSRYVSSSVEHVLT